MCDDDSSDFALEYYRNMRERLTSQGNRLWTRFHYFLTIEAAMMGAFILVPEGLSAGWRFVGLPLIGLCWSTVWFMIAANDLWFYEERYKRLKVFEKEQIVPKVGTVPGKMSKADLPRVKRLVCFKIPKCGATTFSAIVPGCFAVLWLTMMLIKLIG